MATSKKGKAASAAKKADVANVRRVFSPVVGKLIKDFVNIATRTTIAKRNAADGIWSEGQVSGKVQLSTFMRAPKKGHGANQVPFKSGVSLTHEEFRTELKTLVVAGFTAPVREMLGTPTKALEEAESKLKRDWQQQIDSRIGDLRKAIERREAAQDAAEGNARHLAAWGVRQKTALEKLLSDAKGHEFAPDEPIFDLEGYQKSLGVSLAILAKAKAA